MEHLSHNVTETEALGMALAKQLRAGSIIAYLGDLGAGKTAFTRGLAQGLGCTGRVTSPTFTIVNEYEGNEITVYHYDLYRIADEDDLYSTGYFDRLGGEGIVVTEWSELIDGAIPADAHRLRIEKAGETERKFTLC